MDLVNTVHVVVRNLRVHPVHPSSPISLGISTERERLEVHPSGIRPFLVHTVKRIDKRTSFPSPGFFPDSDTPNSKISGS